MRKKCLSFQAVRCLAGWIDNGFWSYSTLDPFLYPVLSSNTKIGVFFKLPKIKARKNIKCSESFYLCNRVNEFS